MFKRNDPAIKQRGGLDMQIVTDRNSNHPRRGAEAIAELLAKGEILAFAEGRFEFGPRALGCLRRFAAGVLLFNFPLLALWDRDVLVFGVPLFPAALFALWALLIALLALILERG